MVELHDELAERLEECYRILRWPEDLESGVGKRRFEEAYRFFRSLLKHEWIAELLKHRDRVRVLDICSGTGIGGLALAKALLDEGFGVELIVNDLRDSALGKAKAYAKRLLNLDIEVLKEDAINLWRHGLRIDIALLYGLSTPHFDPYRMVQLVAGTAWILEPHGVFIVEESDRVYGILCRVGCKDVIIDYAGEDRIVLSINAGYDSRTGTFRNIHLDLMSMRRVALNYRLWDVAGIAAILWAFFEDVDFVPTRSTLHGMLVARKPRGISPETYSEIPKIVRSDHT